MSAASSDARQIPYAVERALEQADDAGLRPIRVYWAAFPVHVAEVSALVTEHEPFDLLDRWVGRAIAEGGYRSVADIAAFLGTTEQIIERVRLFLTQIGHLAGPDGALALTDLGLRSAREDTRYTLKEDRIKLHFDGVTCAPLPSRFYGRGVRLLPLADALAQHRYQLLPHAAEFRADAVASLAARPDRTSYNLPDEHRDLRVLAYEQAFLPCYLIRARTPGGSRTLVFTAAEPAGSDAHLEQIMAGWQEIGTALRTEESDQEGQRSELTKWLEDRGLSLTQLTGWAGHDVPQLRLPAKHFPRHGAPVKARGELPLHQVGSYVTPKSYILHIWCTDQDTRRAAALARSLAYADTGRKDAADIKEFLAQISRRLEISPALSRRDLEKYARETGHGALSVTPDGRD
jgi:hypothetical protein